LAESQVVFDDVQRLPAQQAFPEAPQVPQAPAEQVPVIPLPQTLPDATH
jgi:hypothetical protein